MPVTPFEYILPLVSVLVGLAVADLAVSLHRLLRAWRRVQWDWLPLAAALLAVLAALEFWWIFFEAQEAAFFTTLGGFLPLAAQLVLLFLLNAAALPDAVPDEGLSLRAFYDTNSPLFRSLYAAYVMLIIIARIVGAVQAGATIGGTVGPLLPNLLLLGLFITLAAVRKRTLHGVAVVLLLGLLIAEWSQLSLSAT